MTQGQSTYGPMNLCRCGRKKSLFVLGLVAFGDALTQVTRSVPFARLTSRHVIKVVDDEASLVAMQLEVRRLVSQQLILQSSSTLQVNAVGIDCEWRPENYYSRPSSVVGRSFRYLWRGVFKSVTSFRNFFERIIPPSFSPSNDAITNANAKSKSKSKSKKKGGVGISSPVMVLQVSSRDTVWILDLLKICRQAPLPLSSNQPPPPPLTPLSLTLTREEQLLDSVLSSLMTADNVLKVGLGPTQDLKRLSWSYPYLPSTQRYRTVLDIQTLAKRANPGVAGQELDGLNKLCVRELGLGIDKSLQCSDWSNRPLSKQQINYASLDAAMLVQLFDKLLDKAIPVPVTIASASPTALSGRIKQAVQILAPLLHEYQLSSPYVSEAEEFGATPLRSMAMTQRAMKGWPSTSVLP